VGALLGLHRAPAEGLPTAQEREEAWKRADTVSAFLRRYAAPLAQTYPGTTLPDLRAMSLRDIAHLLYWRTQGRTTDDGPDDDDEFGEVR
jgi:hypothetical protein